MTTLDPLEARIKFLEELEAKAKHHPHDPVASMHSDECTVCLSQKISDREIIEALRSPSTLRMLRGLLLVAKCGRNLQRGLKDRGIKATHSEVKFIEAFGELDKLTAEIKEKP